jgi:uncharacterized protein
MRQALRLALTGVLATCGAASPAAAQVTIVPDTTRAIHVTGSGAVTALPDTATVQVGVAALDSDARKAKATVDAAIGRILALAASLGLQSDSVKSTALNVEPRYERDSDTRLRGYEVTRSVTAVVRDLSKLDALLDGAVQAGANNNFDIEVTSSKTAELQRDALRRALEDARAQADLAAKQLGVRVGAVRSINLNNPGSSLQSMTVNATVGFGTSAAKFHPGTIRVAVQAAVSFFIEDLSK